MNAALSIAAGGMQAAARSFEKAAGTIVSAGAAAASSVSGSPSPQGSGGAPLPSAPLVGDTPDLFEGLIDLKLAEISYKANIEVFKAADRLQDEALDLLA